MTKHLTALKPSPQASAGNHCDLSVEDLLAQLALDYYSRVPCQD